MSLLTRWPRPPAGFRAQLSAGERILAIAEPGERAEPGGTADAGVDSQRGALIATQLGLWLPRTDQDPPWRRVGWDRIVRATWTETGLEIVEGELDEDGLVTDLPAITYRLSEPRNLPSVVRERVETSIARSEQVQVPGGVGRVVARRVPGIDGVVWTARIDAGTPDSPAARALLADYCRQARSASVPD